jgi:predicted DNA-binding WGR domain protein
MAEQLERRYLELIDPRENHFKFYEIVRWDDHTIEVTYGRIGTDGQTQIKRFATARGAVDYLYEKLDEKQRKGYVPCKDDKALKVAKAPPAAPEPLPSKAELAEDFVRLLAQNRDK